MMAAEAMAWGRRLGRTGAGHGKKTRTLTGRAQPTEGLAELERWMGPVAPVQVWEPTRAAWGRTPLAGQT